MDSTISALSPEVVWIVVIAFIFAFFLAFGVGANDVANSFGTSVGSKVLNLRNACILATIFEILGAITLGYKVSNTIRTGMFDVSLFAGEEKRLMLGYLSALIGGAVWNLVATFASLPISGTHSIVGAIIGFSIVAKGFGSVRWYSILRIVASWFISPLLSGLVSVLLFLLIRVLILKKEKPLEPGLRSLPIFYAFTVIINIFSIIHDGPHIFSMIEWWMALIIALIFGFITGIIAWYFLVPYQRKKILLNLEVDSTAKLLKKDANDCLENDHKNSLNNEEKIKINDSNNYINVTNNELIINEQIKDKVDLENGKINTEEKFSDEDKPEVRQLFTLLQILTACFGSFVHGANDVSNAIGPLVAIMLIYIDGNIEQSSDTPWYILLYGGIGISIGLWVWGRRVIKTIGNDLTKITPSRGFTIEVGAATTVLMASKIGLPISTTHCKVGSVVMVGRICAKEGVNWSLFRNITIAWILTVPITAICSACAMALLQLTI